MNIHNVTESIIALGRSNDWFINLILVEESDYIFHDNVRIHIDTSGLKMFMEPESSDFNEKELSNFLLEMIHAKIPDSNYYDIEINLSNNFLGFKAIY